MSKRFSFKTRDETEIPVFPEILRTDLQLQAINKRLRTKYKNRGDERREADPAYNCHGLTFINKLGWITGFEDLNRPKLISLTEMGEFRDKLNGIDIIEVILKGNGLRITKRFNNYEVDRLSGNENIQPGDIVIYKDINNGIEEVTHSGILIELIRFGSGANITNLSSLRVLSKMGFGGEYFHFYNDVPQEYGKIIEIWTDRKL